MSECTRLLISQHRETEAQLSQLGLLLSDAASDWPAIETLAGQLQADLLRHFMLEEQGLFALLNAYRTMILMEVEHDDLLKAQKQFDALLGDSIKEKRLLPDLKSSLDAFTTQLKAHMLEEERGVFPLAESVLEPEEKLRIQRTYAELSVQMPYLQRPTPAFEIRQTGLFQAPAQKISYEVLYDREHALVQHLSLQAGQSLVRHWAGPHQCLVTIAGQCVLSVGQDDRLLEAGMEAILDSRLMFSLKAVTDCHLLIFKIWPHPHYVKA
jgi:iron-sulfur cluster repair protein YtfE (RIC family)